MHEIELSLPAQGEPPNNFAFTLQTIASSLETGGWIPARWYEEKEKQITLGETVSQNPFFLRFVQRLDSFHTLSKRTIVAQDEKEAIAEFFWDVFLPRLPLFKIDRLFFESGSTIAYLSYEFQKRTRRRWVRKWLDEAQFEIKTNNILTYLDFILADPYADPVECTLCPPAPADTYYGATFGELTSGVEMWPPSEPRRLRADAKSATKKMLASLDFKPESTLILMTASGLDDKTQGFHGPHVGSYYNMLFKRLLITSGVPAVVVLEQGKVSKPFLNGRCFPVCDDDGGTSWAAICRDKPLAIATCASTESVRELGKKLRELGFHEQIAGEPIERSGTSSAESRGKGGLSCIVAANSHFSERFKLQRPAAAAMPHAAAPGTT